VFVITPTKFKFFFFEVGRVDTGAQGLTLAWQALHHLGHSASKIQFLYRKVRPRLAKGIFIDQEIQMNSMRE
jgi:hypothetical protein